MPHDNFPRGAGLGRDTNRRIPGLVDFEWTLQHGSRAQRREIIRQLKVHQRRGIEGAAEKLEQVQAIAAARTSLEWLVSLPGRASFRVVCPQRATALEICKQWPGATVEAIDD